MSPAQQSSPTSVRLVYLVFGRIVPMVFFVLLLVLQVELLAPDLRTALDRFPDIESWLVAVNDVLQIAFVGGIALIYLVRKPPTVRRHQPVAVLVAFYASFILLTIRPLQNALGISVGRPGRVLLLASLVLVLAGLAFTIYALAYLRLSFSIVPEARELITGGPYRLARHPIYLGEITTGLGIVIGLMTWFSAALWLSMIVAQLIRSRYEEDVLEEAFPEYATYARRTKRLVPWLV
jgi:protein-S-isoprenylcysteine O-methyltransferase Ste14